MIERLHAIVLRIVKYNDRMRIADVFTKEHGRMSFAIPEGSAKSKHKSARVMWRPLALVEFEAELKGKSNIPRPKDSRVYVNYDDMPYNPMKTMVAMFIDELMCGALWGEQPDEPLYQFVEQSLILLDNVERYIANFHIAFAVCLLKFLGIEPVRKKGAPDVFYDLMAAEPADKLPEHEHRLIGQEAAAFQQIMRMNYRNMRLFRFSRQQRLRTLEVINEFYRLHVPDFRTLKSIAVYADALS